MIQLRKRAKRYNLKWIEVIAIIVICIAVPYDVYVWLIHDASRKVVATEELLITLTGAVNTALGLAAAVAAFVIYKVVKK